MNAEISSYVPIREKPATELLQTGLAMAVLLVDAARRQRRCDSKACKDVRDLVFGVPLNFQFDLERLV
jgi:hypothetical protein